jgi:beta-glucanase (GH16 family)
LVVEPLERRVLLDAAAGATVVGRHVFYNHSAFDGRRSAAGEADDAAVAADKSALLPGQPITPANYTSYSRGINGVMVDVAGLPPSVRLTAADFDFRVGNNGDPSGWKGAAAPRAIAARLLPGSQAVTRITLTWRGRAVRNAWLQVTVNATPSTGLAAADVFYFGNLGGDAVGAAGGAPDGRVDDADVAAAAASLRGNAGIDSGTDFDHSGRITRADVRTARRNLGAALYTVGPFAGLGAGTGATPPALPGQWQLIFSDEFAGASLDPVWHPAQYWDHDLTIVGGDELQAYDPTGISTGDGMLHLTARQDDQYGVPYVSGLVMTGGEKFAPASPRFSFLYGYLEVRAKVPAGRGLWPAVWMMPASFNDDNGEIDVLEVLGSEPTHARFTLHRNGREENHGWDGPDLSGGFHTYAVDWQPDHVSWYVDGIERARTTRAALICPEPMYPILNLAVGALGERPDGTAPFPASMDVDYVRIWQAAPTVP